MFRLIAAIAVIFSLSMQVAAGKDEDRAAFKKAYAAYQQAVASGDPYRTLESAKAAYKAGKKAYGDSHANTAGLALNYAQAANDALDKKEARAATKAAEAHFKNIGGDDAEGLVDVYLMKAATDIRIVGNTERAQKHFDRAIKLSKRLYGTDNFVEALAHKEMAGMMAAAGQPRFAFAHYREAREIFEKHGDDGQTELARISMDIGKFQMQQNNHAAAEGPFKASLAIYEKLDPTNDETLVNHALLVHVYEEQGEREKATRHCQAIGKAKPFASDDTYLPVYFTAPDYPEDAKAKDGGYAIVKFTVDDQGIVHNPEIIEAKGTDGLHDAYKEAAKKFRYAPKFKDGKAVATEGVTYRFTYAAK